MYEINQNVWDVSICSGNINIIGMYQYIWDVSICIGCINMFGMYQYV